jgi:phosphohistidine phosphatase
MRRLFLLRHAKSSLQTEGQDDFDRPLNARGRKDAPVIGASLRDNDIAPDLILCSTACRARETLALVLPFLRGEATIQLEDRLYLASAAKLLARLKQVDGARRQVMIVAHNPGLQDLTLMLSADDKNGNRHAIEGKFPTGALAQIDFNIAEWSSLVRHGGQFARLITPRSRASDL